MLHIGRLDAVLADEAQHLGHARVGERARGMRLDGDARLLEGPGRAELAGDGLHVVAAAGRAEEAAWRFQDLVGGGPAVSCELRRSEERRVGKGVESTCRYRGGTYN